MRINNIAAEPVCIFYEKNAFKVLCVINYYRHAAFPKYSGFPEQQISGIGYFLVS